jgi:hypothetical protein
MAASVFRTATEYTANELTLLRGAEADIVSVGVAMISDPLTVPAVAAFTTVLLIGPVHTPGHALLEGTKIDVVAKIGPGGGAVSAGHFAALSAGDYQRWVLVTTADEHIIRRPDVVTIA